MTHKHKACHAATYHTIPYEQQCFERWNAADELRRVLVENAAVKRAFGNEFDDLYITLYFI